MKKGWERYASQKGIVQKGYLRKYSNGSTVRKTREAIRSDCVQQSRESQEKEVEIQVIVPLTEPITSPEVKVKKKRKRKSKQ